MQTLNTCTDCKCVCQVEYHKTLNKKGILQVGASWVNPEYIMVHEVRQTLKDIFSHVDSRIKYVEEETRIASARG